MTEENVLASQSSVPSHTEFVLDNNDNANERTPLLQGSQSNMAEKNVGVSQETLVSQAGQSVRARKFPQYVASLAATLGAVATGMVLGWTSPAGKDGIELQATYSLKISPEEFSWIGALAPLGAGVACMPIGILADLIGRKNSMLALVVPFTIGWLCLIFADSLALFYIGRFITGFSGGAFCVTAPMYTAEISEKDIRGSLGSYFQLLLTVGILLAYLLGTVVNMFQLTIISAVVPIIFCVVFSFMPETPTYYLMKGNEDGARASYIRLRGAHYNVEPELSMQRDALEETNRNKVSFFTAIRSKASSKALIIAYGLMVFQQLCGVNAVIFYAGAIFASAGGSINSDVASIIIGVIQVVAVFISTLIIDRLGRRMLLAASIIVLCVCSFVLGVYFYLLETKHDVTNIDWLPIVSLCIFIILFSLGFGPIPWMMVGEIFAPEVKGVAASSACLLNWLLAFVVTKTYTNLNEVLQSYGTFWLFSVISAIGFFFVLFLVPETKGKSLEDIQRELGS